MSAQVAQAATVAAVRNRQLREVNVLFRKISCPVKKFPDTSNKFPVPPFKFPVPKLREIFRNRLILGSNSECAEGVSLLIRVFSLYLGGYQGNYPETGSLETASSTT
jgi:hypothetical protein